MNGALEFRHCVTNDIDNTGMRATIIPGELLDAIRKADKIYNQEGRRVSVATQAKQEQREGTRAIIGWQKSVE